MLHSGSRALGKHVCDHFNHLARDLNQRQRSPVPREAQLAYLPLDADEGRDYVAWMQLCLRYAEENRRRMLEVALDRLFDAVRANQPDREIEITEAVDTHHNYATPEVHFGEEVWVHRKGAVRALEDEMVIIPGSMETGSYVARGLGNPESFQSCSHGAGRRLSRTAALKARTAEQVLSALRHKGIELAKRSHKDVAEEAGHAYKDVAEVISQQRDLVEPVYTLRPLGVVKG
jgi:tRNA-splicing ligase RtcB